MNPFSTVNNLILVVLIVGVGAIWGYAAYSGPPTPDVQEEEIAQEMGEMLQENSDTIVRESYELTRDVVPPLADAMQKQLEEDYPKYVRILDRESATYLEDLEQTLMQETKKQMDDFWVAQRDVVAAEFPEYASREEVDQLIAEFRKVGDRLMERYSIDELKNQSVRTMTLWEQVEPIEQASEEQTREQLLKYLSDWLVLKLSDKAESQITQIASEG